MAKRINTPPVISRQQIPQPPASQELPPIGNASLEDILNGTAPPTPQPPSQGTTEEGTETVNDALVDLGGLRDQDAPQTKSNYMFSDEPPPGWGEGEHRVVGMDIQNSSEKARSAAPQAPELPIEQRPDLKKWSAAQFPSGPNTFDPARLVPSEPFDPSAPQYDPHAVSTARQSLQEDAHRARIAARVRQQAPAPTSNQPVIPMPNASHDVRGAIAEAQQNDPGTQYRSRISVATAYKFDGHVRNAPGWVNRNWLAYDTIVPPGPALNIPGVGIVKQGHWMVVQNIIDDDGSVMHTEIKVYDDWTFRSLFMQVQGLPSSEGDPSVQAA